MTVRRLTAAIMLLGLFATAAPALAADQAAEARDLQTAPEARRPGQIARDAADDLMRRLEELAAVLPRYGLPQIAENGDIVIPRLDRPQMDRLQPDRPKTPGSGAPGEETLDL